MKEIVFWALAGIIAVVGISMLGLGLVIWVGLMGEIANKLWRKIEDWF